MNLACLLCGGLLDEKSLSLGKQPVTKNLLDDVHKDSCSGSLEVSICKECATVQIAEPWSYEAFVPWYDWITFREPEDHLDDVVHSILRDAGFGRNAFILGISPKDDTTLTRFERLGYKNVYRIDPMVDLNIVMQNAYIESIQNGLTTELAQGFAEARGRADCIIVRHILEHAEEPIQFLAALRALLKPDGVIIFEVPDCEPALERSDYALIWEEHNLYFTEKTLSNCLAQNGFKERWRRIYPYAFENSIVVVAESFPRSSVRLASQCIQEESTRFFNYQESFNESFQFINRVVGKFCDEGYTIVLFGAGHLGCSFVNYFDLSKRLAFAVDDAPEKLGLFLPGSRLEIRPSTGLDGIDSLLCLLSVTPAKEDAVVERLQRNLEPGVVYASIVSSSKRYIGGSAWSVDRIPSR